MTTGIPVVVPMRHQLLTHVYTGTYLPLSTLFLFFVVFLQIKACFNFKLHSKLQIISFQNPNLFLRMAWDST